MQGGGGMSEKPMTTLFEVGSADVADTSDDCYTPRWIFDAASLVFDMDVAAPVDPARRTCPAREYLSPLDDGLAQPWHGVVWMNPPFSALTPWVEKFSRHGCGMALFPAPRKEVYWFGAALRCADALTFLSADFTNPDGSLKRIGYQMILIGCGPVAAAAVSRVAAADKYVQGAYFLRPEGGADAA